MSLYSRLDRLAADVAKLDRKVDSVSNAPQSQRTSVEGGSIDFNDDDGNLMAIVGSQDDGGNTINVISGPTPPTPVGFTVGVDHGKFIVHWSGDFDGDKLAPSDWSRAEVHASQDPFFVPSRATARGSIVSAAGGEVTIGVLKGPWTIKMLAWSQAGKMSAPSAPVDVEVPGYGDIVLEEIDAATTLIKNAGEMLIEGQQTLADKLAGIADLDPEEISDEIAQARQEAIDAALAEIANVEGTLTSAIGGKSSTKWSTSNPPANYDGAVGDTWVKLTSLGSGGREIRRSRWQGDVWVDHPVDGAVLSNVDASTITTGFLDVVNRIRTGAIFADKLLIGSGANLIPGADKMSTSAVGFPGMEVDPAENALRVKGKQTLYSAAEFKLPPGKYRMTVDLKSSAPTNTYIGIYHPTPRWIYAINNQPITTSWATYSGTLEVSEANQDYPFVLRLLPAYTGDIGEGYTWYRNLSLRPMAGGTLITPGGVQTPHLAADVLEVGNLKAGTAALAEAVIKKLFAEVVVARMAQAEEFIGENALLTNSVTAPKIVASEELWAKLGQFVKIRSEHIESDALDFMVARGGTYLTSGGNGSWSDNGLFISGPDGTSLVRFPTDGTPLSLTASDVQIDRASIGELDTTQQTVRSGGTLTLASGVTAPASPPKLNASWERENQLPRPAESSMDWTGLAYWKGMYLRGVNVLGSAGDSADRIEVYNPDGTLNKSIPIDLNPRAGVAVIGDIVYTIGPDHVARPGAEKQWCHGFNLNTGSRVSRWEFVNFFAKDQAQIALGTDGTNLVAAGVAPNVVLSVFKYDPATGTQVGAQLTDTGWNISARELFGVQQVGADIYITHKGSTRVYTVSGSTMTRKTGSSNGSTWAGWSNPNKNAGGMTFVDGVPLVVDSGAVYTGSSFTADATVQACFTWTNGTHETTPSPVADVQVFPRESVKVSLPVRAGLQKNLYMKSSQNGGNWAKTTVPETTTSVLIGEVLAGLNAPPSQNTFPASTPAVLKSGVGNLVFRGDGSGRIGPLTFNANGSMTGFPKLAHGKVVVNAVANTTTSAAVTLPAGMFTSVPDVVVTAGSSSPYTSVQGVSVNNVTTTSFDVFIRRANTDNTGIHWIAIGD